MSKVFNVNISEKEVEPLFESDEKCLEFLANIKWANGYVCKKCGNTNFCAGKQAWSRRCTRCKHKETATNGTIFHGVKFPISKAFYIAYNVCKNKEDISTYEFARRLSLRQMTCWNFKSKIQHALLGIESLSDKERDSIEKILTC